MSQYQGDEPEMTREEFLARQRAGMPAGVVASKAAYVAEVQASAQSGFRVTAMEFHTASALTVGEFSGLIEGDRFADLRGVLLSEVRTPV